MKKTRLIQSALVVAAALSCSAALADPGGNFNQPFRHYTGAIYYPLQAPVSLPYLPDWNGYKSVFFHGKKGEKPERGSVGWDIQYCVMEETGQILDFYTNAFKQNGWKVSPVAKNGKSVSAYREKDRTQCIISITPPLKPGYKNTLVIGYTIFKKPSASEPDDQQNRQNYQNQNQPRRY